jgi:hypothetical protein
MTPVGEVPLIIERPKTRTTERGELLQYFSQKLNRPIPYVAFRLTKMDLPTLYYIKSDCDQAANRGIPWGAAFYTSIKPKQ